MASESMLAAASLMNGGEVVSANCAASMVEEESESSRSAPCMRDTRELYVSVSCDSSCGVMAVWVMVVSR